MNATSGSLPFPSLSPEEAAALIHNGQTVGFSGFTPAGAAKAIPKAIAARARDEHNAGRPFQIGVITGASTGASLDGELAIAGLLQSGIRENRMSVGLATAPAAARLAA